MNFKKMHGLGNDFVILDSKDLSGPLSPGQIKHICDRNFGVGCDLLTVLEPSDNADVFARFLNADGSESAACGNASRCVADIVMRELGSDACTIETGRGILHCTRAESEMVTVDMGAPLEVQEIPSPDNRLPSPITVNMGNPHCVFFVDDVESVDIETLGPSIENMTGIFPDRTNVEFVEITGDNQLRQRTWERGVGVTLACGSGACAVALAAQTSGLTGNKVEITLDGGPVFIEIHETDGHILMTGSVAYVFDGEMKL